MEIMRAAHAVFLAHHGYPVQLSLPRPHDEPGTVYVLVLDPLLQAKGVSCSPASVDEHQRVDFYLSTSHVPVDIRGGQRVGVLCRMP